MDAHDRREMARREQDRSQEERIEELENRLDTIEDLLRPISETYTTSTQLGKWIMGLAVFVSIAIGVLLSLKSLLRK